MTDIIHKKHMIDKKKGQIVVITDLNKFTE